MDQSLSDIEAIREATDQEMERDGSVVIFGLDVDDPKAIQGTPCAACLRNTGLNVFSERRFLRTP